MELNLIIPGEPVGKHQTLGTMAGHPSLFLPPKIKAYVELIADYARLNVVEQGWKVGDGQTPLYINIEAHFPVRKSWSKKRVAEALAGRFHTSTPDIDNIQKCIYDGLVGPKMKGQARTHEQIVMVDDGQVAMCRVAKLYCPLGQERVEITVVELVRLPSSRQAQLATSS